MKDEVLPGQRYEVTWGEPKRPQFQLWDNNPYVSPVYGVPRPVALVGGKGHSLQVLHENRFQVPEGFILTPDLLEMPTFRGGRGEGFVEAVSSLFGILSTDLAVRSSATTEDGENTSFAGQHKSYFVTRSTPKTLHHAVLGVCLSLTDSAAYREAHGLGPTRMAVIVQRMLHPSLAGVLFTQDPVTHTPGIVVECVAGLADKLVSGHVTPGGEEMLDKVQKKKLFTEAERAKKVFGCELDMEWVFVGKNLWFVQARPVTA